MFGTEWKKVLVFQKFSRDPSWMLKYGYSNWRVTTSNVREPRHRILNVDGQIGSSHVGDGSACRPSECASRIKEQSITYSSSTANPCDVQKSDWTIFVEPGPM